MKLKEFLDIYNFRDFRPDVKSENGKFDTVVIRVYLNNELSNHDYVEFGVYDFCENEYKQKLYEKFINKEILNSKVSSMYFDYDLNTFCVCLGEN